MKLEVLYREERFAVVGKPSGVLVHRGWARDGVVLVDLVRREFRQKKVHPIHRLDRGASGVTLFALDPEMARMLKELSEGGGIEKRYLMLVRGKPPDGDVIDHPIARRPKGPKVPAVTEYRRLATADCQPRTVSLVEARPRSGRLHQIRRHMKHIHHPLLGDANYGKGALNRAMRDQHGLARLALHAHHLTMPHPLSGETLDIFADLPVDLVEPMRSMGLMDKERSGFLPSARPWATLWP